MIRSHTIVFASALLFALVAGCSDDSSSGSASSGEPGAGLSQGGAQDFGLFRDILERGEIPGPETLDELGFFAEHKIELPAADCGDTVCIHGILGVMGNFISGSNCTMVLIGLNTPLDPTELARPPLDIAIAVDTSGSMAGDPITYVREGLIDMLPNLDEADRVTLIAYSEEAEVVVLEADPGSLALENAINGLAARGTTNIYDGLRLAFETLPAEDTSGRARRVVLLSDGLATAGIVEDARIIRMARGFTTKGIGLSTIGVGEDFDVELMRTLSESGAGNFYFLEDPSAVREVFTEEVNTFLVPIAQDVKIAIQEGAGYTLRRIHGTRLWQFTAGGARIEIPSLFVAGRVSVDDNAYGRRGGGGAIVAELLPVRGSPEGPGKVSGMTITWTDPATGEQLSQEVDVQSSLSPGETPTEGLFGSEAAERAFVMLNIYIGFEMATERAADGALSDALRILRSMRANVAVWLEGATEAEDDIADDLVLIDRFIDNLVLAGANEPPPSASPEPWLYD